MDSGWGILPSGRTVRGHCNEASKKRWLPAEGRGSRTERSDTRRENSWSADTDVEAAAAVPVRGRRHEFSLDNVEMKLQEPGKIRTLVVYMGLGSGE